MDSRSAAQCRVNCRCSDVGGGGVMRRRRRVECEKQERAGDDNNNCVSTAASEIIGKGKGLCLSLLLIYEYKKKILNMIKEGGCCASAK